jgi:hypothetical protein
MWCAELGTDRGAQWDTQRLKEIKKKKKLLQA